MRQITTALKSSKVATLLALSLVVVYAATEFGDHPSHRAYASLSLKPAPTFIPGAVDSYKMALLNIPTPLLRPNDLPAVEQPYQITVVSLTNSLNSIAFDLDQIRRGHEVPRHFIQNMPTDILDIENVTARKNLFLSVTLPLILKVNEDILKHRAKLKNFIAITADGTSLSIKQATWLNRLAKRYGGNANDFTGLLKRVDTIPVSLALAQSIEESGWGTSRFAREGNALFGQRAWSAGEGLVPHGRAEGEQYEVKAFDALLQSIENYAVNLNSFGAYEDFRTKRARQRTEFGITNGYELTATLTSYSERGTDYIEALQALIRVNNLGQFEETKLSPERLAQIFSSSNN
ncbi:MAG: glucosaminidase domain-containing protein [Sneathiella sp.]|nr:glucosaminidase domain-containing protein [Sneathiella sp.]